MDWLVEFEKNDYLIIHIDVSTPKYLIVDSPTKGND